MRSGCCGFGWAACGAFPTPVMTAFTAPSLPLNTVTELDTVLVLYTYSSLGTPHNIWGRLASPSVAPSMVRRVLPSGSKTYSVLAFWSTAQTSYGDAVCCASGCPTSSVTPPTTPMMPNNHGYRDIVCSPLLG